MNNAITKTTRIITLKEIVDLINADRLKKGLNLLRHNDQMQRVLKMEEESSKFGSLRKIRSNYNTGNKGSIRFLETYFLTKTQALIIGAMLDIDRAILIIKRLEELEQQNIIQNLPSYQIENPIERAKKWILEQKKMLGLENKILIDKPKIDFYNTVTGSNDTLEIGKVAKLLNKKIGRNKLFKILRKEKILMQNNLPYQKYIDSGYFRVIESKFTKDDGSVHINLKTVVFQKGIDFLNKSIF